MKTGQKVALITFGLFMAEAIMHYNMGKSDNVDKDKKEVETSWLPPTKSLVRLAIVVGAFSMLNGLIIKEVV